MRIHNKYHMLFYVESMYYTYNIIYLIIPIMYVHSYTNNVTFFNENENLKIKKNG
jgi:hypothetical protein